MKSLFPVLFAIAVSIASFADSPQSRRDDALKKINACLKRNEVSSRQCKRLNQNLQTLVDVYRAGDKSVLPMLFRFTYLTDFYDEALRDDPDGFLAQVGELSEEDRSAVIYGLAGGILGIRSQRQFKEVREALEQVPDSAPKKVLAQLCLGKIEHNNASFLVTYFPPRTFAHEFMVRWFSNEMYDLGEKPLWPAATNEATFRFIYLPAFAGASVVSLKILDDGTGQISAKALDRHRELANVDETRDLSKEAVSAFSTRLDQSHFWASPTEIPTRGLDGAEWILEGLQDGRYHAVVRWCPDIAHRSGDEVSFALTARFLSELAGHKREDGC